MRKKVLALIIILCLALGMTAAFAACDNTGKLDAPTGFTVNKDTQTLTWTPVENAVAYDFYVTDEQGARSNVNNIPAKTNDVGTPVTPSQSLAGITEKGTYTIHVQALADDEDVDVSGNPVHQDSDVAEYTYVRGEQYGNPQNVKAKYAEAQAGTGVKGLRVTFDAVEGAADYAVQILSGDTLLLDTTTASTSNLYESYTEKDSDNNETAVKFADKPGKYTVQVRANAPKEGNDIPSSWSKTSAYVTAQLANPLITKYSFTSETVQRLRWTQVSKASSITVEAWKIDATDEDNEMNDSALSLFKNIEKYAKEHEADYSYKSSSGTAQNTTLSNLNMTEPGEYLITVRANGDESIYYSSPRVNVCTADEADESTRLYTATVVATPQTGSAMPEGDAVNIDFNDINPSKCGITDTLYIRFTKDVLNSANMFKIVLSSVNTSSANSLSDITASVRLELGTGDNADKVVIRTGSDEYEAAALTEKGDGYLLTYSLERIFHSAAEDGAKPTHNQTSSNLYGRYFNVQVQACYYQNTDASHTDEGATGNVTARVAGKSLTLPVSYLSACEPEVDESGNTYTIKTTYVRDEEDNITGIYATARAQLMYIQKLMLTGFGCSGKTFILAEDIDFANNAWLALDNAEFNGVIKSAEIEYSEGVTRSGEYTISNLFVLNKAALEYARAEEHESACADFTENYAMFPVFSGTIRHVNFLDVTVSDGEYSYTVPGQEATENKEATEDEEKYQRVSTSAVIAGENNGTIEYVFVSGSFTPINTSGVIAAVNNGKIIACESDIAVNATAYSKLEEGQEEEDNTAYVGGLVGHNASGGSISASSHRGQVTLTNTALGNTAAGGFVGYNEGSIENSYATGNVKTDATKTVYTGGFVGINGGQITSSYYGSKFTAGAYGNIGEVRAEYAGGFVGNNTGSITKAYAIARVSGSKEAGGFAVANSGGTISYAYSAGTTRIQNTAPSFIWGAQTPENCFMYDYNGGQQGGSLAGLNNETLTANGFAKAGSYQTPVLEGALYVENFKERVIVGGTPSTQGVIVTGGKESKVVYGVEQTALEGGYTVTVYVTDGAGRFGLSGTALVKYVVTNSSDAAVSCATVTVTI